MGVIGLAAVTSIGLIVIIAAVIAITRVLHFRYRGRRAVTDEQYERWRSWAVDTHEWSITDEAEDDPEAEGMQRVRRGDGVAAPADLETGQGAHHQEEDEPARTAGHP